MAPRCTVVTARRISKHIKAYRRPASQSLSTHARAPHLVPGEPLHLHRVRKVFWHQLCEYMTTIHDLFNAVLNASMKLGIVDSYLPTGWPARTEVRVLIARCADRRFED
jgi:hypothetical protein